MIQDVIDDLKQYRIGVDTNPNGGNPPGVFYAGAVAHLPTQKEVDEVMLVDIVPILETLKSVEVNPHDVGVTDEELRDDILETILERKGWHVGNSDNSYNWSGCISNDINICSVYPPDTPEEETKNEYSDYEHIVFRVHRWGDVRGNYSEDMLVHCTFMSWLEDEYEWGFSDSKIVEVEGKEFAIDYSIFNEEMRVMDAENWEDVGYVYTSDIKEAEQDIFLMLHYEEIKLGLEALERFAYARPYDNQRRWHQDLFELGFYELSDVDRHRDRWYNPQPTGVDSSNAVA
jgi:hypothetical protein